MSGPLDTATTRTRIDNRPAELPNDTGFWNRQSWTTGFEQAQSGPDIGTNEARYVNDAGNEILMALRAKGYRVDGGYQQTSILGMMLHGTRLGGMLTVKGAAGNRRLFRALADAKARFPKDFEQYAAVSDQSSLMTFANARQRADYQRAQAAGERLTGGGKVAAILGGIGAQYDDPDAWLGVLGGGSGAAGRSVLATAMRGGAREAGINAGFAIASEPLIDRSAERLGIDRTWGDTAWDVGVQAGFGGLTGAVGDGLASAFRRRVPATSRTPEEHGALDAVAREDEHQAASPYEPGPAGDAMHTARTVQASGLLRTGERATIASRLGDAHRAIEGNESRGRQFDASGRTLTSPKGALGLMQIMPTTGPEAARLAGVPWSLERLRNDPEYNRMLGRAYYNEMLRQFDGDAEKAAAAYNAGPGSARKGNGLRGAMARAAQRGEPENWRAYLPAETRAYVAEFRRRMGGAAKEIAPGRVDDGGGDARLAALDDDAAEIEGAMARRTERAEQNDAPITIPMPELRRETFASTAEWRAAQRDADDDLAGTARYRGAPADGAPADVLSERATAEGELPERAGADADAERPTLSDAEPPMLSDDELAPWREAVATMRAQGEGEAPGALSHPGVGPIDVIWGGERGGLAHIISRHPDVVDRLPEHLARMEVVRRSPTRMRLESEENGAGVRLDYDGEKERWLVTTYSRDAAPAPAEVARASAKEQSEPTARRTSGDIGEGVPAINDAVDTAEFAEPGGAGNTRTLASALHDARQRVGNEPDATAWIDGDHGPQQVKLIDVIQEHDADMAAILAARNCM